MNCRDYTGMEKKMETTIMLPARRLKDSREVSHASRPSLPDLRKQDPPSDIHLFKAYIHLHTPTPKP